MTEDEVVYSAQAKVLNSPPIHVQFSKMLTVFFSSNIYLKHINLQPDSVQILSFLKKSVGWLVVDILQ